MRGLLDKLHRLGHFFFYVTLKLFGQRGAYLLADLVVGVYLLFSRRIHRVTAPYLSRRFPGEGRVKHTFLLVRSLARSLVDRAWLGLDPDCGLTGVLEGGEKLEAALAEGRGLVGVTAHVGNWQTAFSFLGRLEVTAHVVMRYEEEAAARHFFQLKGEAPPFQIIDPTGFMGGLAEARTALEAGEIVIFMADRAEGGATVSVPFLGEAAAFPLSPFLLAATMGAPVGVMLSAKTGRLTQTMTAADLFHPALGERGAREEALTPYVERYVRALEGYVASHPWQWYNFYDFWQR